MQQYDINHKNVTKSLMHRKMKKIFRDDPFQSSLAILPYAHPKQKKPSGSSGWSSEYNFKSSAPVSAKAPSPPATC